MATLFLFVQIVFVWLLWKQKVITILIYIYIYIYWIYKKPWNMDRLVLKWYSPHIIISGYVSSSILIIFSRYIIQMKFVFDIYIYIYIYIMYLLFISHQLIIHQFFSFCLFNHMLVICTFLYIVIIFPKRIFSSLVIYFFFSFYIRYIGWFKCNIGNCYMVVRYKL